MIPKDDPRFAERRAENPDYFDWMYGIVEQFFARHRGDLVPRTLDEWTTLIWEFIGSGEYKEAEPCGVSGCQCRGCVQWRERNEA